MHILFDIVDGEQLRLGFLVFKGTVEFLFKVSVGRVGKAGARGARGIQSQQVFGKRLCGALGAAFGLFPFLGAHFGKLHGAVFSTCADIFGDQLQSVGRDKECVGAGISDGDIVAAHPFKGHSGDALKAADTVHLVYHEIAFFELVIGENLLPCRHFFALCRAHTAAHGGLILAHPKKRRFRRNEIKAAAPHTHTDAHGTEGECVTVKGSMVFQTSARDILFPKRILECGGSVMAFAKD